MTHNDLTQTEAPDGYVIRHKATGLLLRQHHSTGQVIGWTNDGWSCRVYRRNEAPSWRAKAGLLVSDADILPLSVVR